MDRRSADLSRQGLAIFSEQVSPEYDRVRELLLGRLASASARVEDLALVAEDEEAVRRAREKIENAKLYNDEANVELITNFVDMLPSAYVARYKDYYYRKRESFQFKFSDEYELKMIQSVLIWVSTFEKEWGAPKPFYVLGEAGNLKMSKGITGRRIKNKTTSFLLAPAQLIDEEQNSYSRDENAKPTLYTLKASRKAKKAIRATSALASTDYPSPEEVKTMFDKTDHRLHLGSNSPGSQVVKVFTPDFNFLSLTRLSDEQLGQYDVHSSLHGLAVRLDLESQLEELLQKHADGVESVFAQQGKFGII